MTKFPKFSSEGWDEGEEDLVIHSFMYLFMKTIYWVPNIN